MIEPQTQQPCPFGSGKNAELFLQRPRNRTRNVDDTPVHKVIREALANCLVNADYYGRRGIVIVKQRELITLSPRRFPCRAGRVAVGRYVRPSERYHDEDV